jgi:hypothetical protein
MVTKYKIGQKTSTTSGGIHSGIWLGSFKDLVGFIQDVGGEFLFSLF